MAFPSDLYKECQAVLKTLSLKSGKVKFNKSLCSLLTSKYVASLTYLDNKIFREDSPIDLPCRRALVELRRIMSCGQELVTDWTRKDWWMSVIKSSDSASLDKKVILHLREFLACVNVLVQMKTNMTYDPALDSLDSSVQQACRTDIEGLILSMKKYRRAIIFPSKFAKLAKHLSEKLEAEISNPYTIDFPLDVDISYKDCLGGGSFGTVYKCTFLGVEAAAKVWNANCKNKEAAEKEARLSSKLRHPNVVQFIGYGLKENRPVIISELMDRDLRSYLDEKKENADEGPPLPLLVAMNILLQLAEAMNYLHENGVMHRDLKASNVLINVVEGPDGQPSSSSVQVKLTDFGNSKLKLHNSRYTTPRPGTTKWMAPEVLNVEENRQKYTKSADVYSFSMLCFEVLTGDFPFEGKRCGTLLERIREGERPELPGAGYCPDYLSELIKKCWATNAEERPRFPVILQLLMDYKARYLKHPYRGEDVPPDSSQDSQTLDIADTADTRNVIEDDNNHCARKSATSLLQQVQGLSVDRPYWEFSFQDLEAATTSFSPVNCVRRVDWGELYSGKLQDGRPVAIMLRNQEDPTKDKSFLTDIEINTCLSHANILSPIGYCVENTRLILVYDFMHQRTLEDHLHGEENVLGWEVRYKVALGICKALEYLHDGSPRSVIHRNVKPSKILVSHNFQPKLSGLEFATWAPERSIYQADKVVGTIGYLDPEYAITGRFSDKSDVYSFGVVLVELITGRKVKDGTRPQGEKYLMAWARPLLDERNLDVLVDPQLGNTYNVSEMKAMISAAALCVQQSSQRPKISEVLKKLDEFSNTDED